MTRRRLGLVGVVLLVIAIGIWVVLLGHKSAGSMGSKTVAEIPVHASGAPGSLAPIKSVERSKVWTRPPPEVAARNLRRVRFAALRRFGASQKIVDRLTDGDIQSVIQELNQQAQHGDASAANVLEYMARFNCEFARINGEHSESQAQQLLDANGLPERDAQWIRATIDERNKSDSALAVACQGIDKKEVAGLVAKASDLKNPASLYLQWRFRGNQSANLSQRQLRAAVDVGYPEAQAWMAQTLTNGASGLPASGEGADTLYKEAATSLPYAESLQAICEFTGCLGIEADIPSAVAHAREAAQRGSFDAMIEIGPKLQESQIDPDEVAAWNLVGAMLVQQGCSSGGGLTVQGMTSATNTLTSNRFSDKVRSLAEEYWSDYGTQMMSNIGCL